ncbi:unnamed protein product [Soboliphyme baturini]|uniref:Uncharacterized protein n=1 Tax=Soboliphyme baturini TaxID=241478 RepID=A0A183IIF8_9BILA|nr:unnamed protein product [Soboliphyme baturini]
MSVSPSVERPSVDGLTASPSMSMHLALRNSTTSSSSPPPPPHPPPLPTSRIDQFLLETLDDGVGPNDSEASSSHAQHETDRHGFIADDSRNTDE